MSVSIDNMNAAKQAIPNAVAQSGMVGLGIGLQQPAQPSLTTVVARLNNVVSRIRASSGQAEALADALAPTNAKSAQNGSQSPEPAGLVDQMMRILTNAEDALNSLGHSLDRLDRAHG